MPPTGGAIVLLVGIVIRCHPSSATIAAPMELLSNATDVEISPNDTWSCCGESGNCIHPSLPSCAFDGISSTRWKLRSGQRKATISVGLNPGAIIDHFVVSFDSSSVIPSSVSVTLFGNDVTWTTYNNKSCRPSDRTLRKEDRSLYYSCTPAGQFWNVQVPLGVFSVQNGSDGWLWWNAFSRLQLTMEASDADYNNQTDNSSIAIADVRLYGWNQPNSACKCHPLVVENAEAPCDSNGICKCKAGVGQCILPALSITIAKGMISGGTTFNLTLPEFISYNVSRITLGNDYQCSLRMINATLIEIQTPAANSSDLRSALPIWICWEVTRGALSCLITNLNFTYFPDPVVYSITPRTTIVYGGITQTIIGENLDLAMFPYINVFFVQQTQTPKRCTTVNSTMLTCLTMPLYGVLVGTSEYNSYTGYIGISLDNISLYNNYSNCAVPCDFTIWRNPTTNPWDDPRDYLVYKGRRAVYIGGPYFSSVCPEHEYRVEVGGIVCEIVEVNHNTILFYPPDVASLEDASKVQDTTLYVGAYYKWTVGRLRYVQSEPINGALIGGLVGGIGGFILLVVIVILIVCCYRKRKEKEGLVDYEPRCPPTPRPLTEYLSSDEKTQIEKYTIPYYRIQLVSELGKGNFGKVFRGTLTDRSGAKQPVAIKSLHGHHDVKDRVEFVKEALVMADFCHKHVLSLIAIVIEQNVPFVVLPLMELGDLKTYISKDKNSFTVGRLVNFSLQVSEGMEYLASRKFVHRDLAARNCMINKDLLVKVADFGLARDIFEKDYYRAQDQQRPLPVRWMAIECLASNTEFTEKSDVWSYGVLVWELMTRGKRPYSDVDNLDLRRFLLQGRRLEKPPVAPDFVYAIMLRCWLPERNDRPRFNNIVKELKEILSAAEASGDPSRPLSFSNVAMDVTIGNEERASYLQLSGNPQQ